MFDISTPKKKTYPSTLTAVIGGAVILSIGVLIGGDKEQLKEKELEIISLQEKKREQTQEVERLKEVAKNERWKQAERDYKIDRLNSQVEQLEEYLKQLESSNNNLKQKVKQKESELARKNAIKEKEKKAVKEQPREEEKVVYNSSPEFDEGVRISSVDQSNSSSSPLGGGATYNMTATAYTSDPAENGGYSVTALGTPLRVGVCAVDPNVIPLGSTIHVEGHGTCVAEDTGGAIKGNRVDVLKGSKSESAQWGVRNVKVTVY